MVTREEWISAAGGLSKAVETENQILSIGREYLPACAIEVLNGAADGESDYWAFLISQLADDVPFDPTF